MMKKILVTGGSGHIGKISVPLFRELGYAVRNYDIKENPKDDIFDEERLQAAMVGNDAIYHLVAIPHPYKAMEHEYKRINYDGAIRAFECAIRARVSKFIFASSGCVYGFWGGRAIPASLPINEDNPIPSIEEGNTVYGHMKHAFERYLAKQSEKAGIRSVSLRLEGVGSRRTMSQAYGLYTDNGRIPVGSSVVNHFFACCSRENYRNMLQLAVEVDLESYFEAFNVGNQWVDESIDVQAMAAKHWPGVPNCTNGNEALFSVEKAKRLLGYRPVC